MKAKLALNWINLFLGVALAFVVIVYPEVPTAAATIGVLLVAGLVASGILNKIALKELSGTRAFQYGATSALTIGLVLALVVVLNFLGYSHPVKKDFTRNKAESLSEQTLKILGDLKQDVQLTVFVQPVERENAKRVLDRYTYASKRISVEYVNPDQDPVRAKEAGVRKYGTVLLKSTTRTATVEDVSEEKLTNGLLKVLKDKAVTVCSVTGHGERGLDVNEPAGYSSAKKILSAQNYDSKSINLVESGKVPDECTIVMILGPSRAYFDKEVDLLKAWAEAGGRVFVALDPDIRGTGGVGAPFLAWLNSWNVKVEHNLVLDPSSKLLNADASVALVLVFAAEHAVTKDFSGKMSVTPALFPMTSSIEVMSSNASPKVSWLVKSTPQAILKSDFKEVASGRVKVDTTKDRMGSFPLMVAAEKTAGEKPAGAPGSEKAAPLGGRMIVVGNSNFGSNQWFNHGSNMDLFTNAVSWLANDESLISIRQKEEEVPVLSAVKGSLIGFLSLFLMPFGIGGIGAVQYVRRRKL